ncbi:ribosomal protein S18-alanine N-acetyltransferase [Janibacter melonis]|uniref:ribosomal protein S18-alanine N-acetyltransferase n=1 Tax=Janibacter melonis TaxID=262209 RepID=UPI00204478D5|nr:ribosomal protein S18-alanine N-acetyltransferase [Janibacter melonis]MCM3554357.1 ribosomal protein S18-alanine N-acetyltransferase [Janibacter melonis]
MSATATTPTWRAVGWRDIPALAALEQQIYPDDAWSEQSWWGELAARPRRDYVLVEDDEGVLAYAGLDHGGEVGDVMTIAVAPRGRRSGLGRALLDDLVARARAGGAARLLLEVRADNVAARAMYEAAGMSLLSTRRGYYPGGVDALVLGLDLATPSPPDGPESR